jgi:signal transduction histidine kinase
MTEPGRPEKPETGHSQTPRRQGIDAAQRVAAGMLHEIRNILNSIVSATYLMNVNAHDPVKVRDLAARIEGFAKAEERLAARMRELLEREAAADTQPAPAVSAVAPAVPRSPRAGENA